MKSVGVLKLIAAVIFGGLVGCVTTGIGQDSKDSGRPPVSSGSLGEQITFSYDEKGRLIPMTKDGKPYVACGKGTKRKCSLFREKITITDEPEIITIVRVKSKASPECEDIIMEQGGQRYYFEDPFCGQY